MTSGDYRDSHTAPGKGEAYHVKVTEGSYHSLVWEWEQKVLLDIVQKSFGSTPCRYLDFACGTGRIIGLLEDRVTSATGVDISEEMLQVARSHLTRSQLIHGDLTRADLLGGRKMDLVTAFRFFRNAQPELRTQAFAALARTLAPGGRLVINTHLQTWSVAHLAKAGLAWTRMHAPRFSTFGMRDVRRLCDANGLNLVRVDHWGVFPASDRRMPISRERLRRLEEWASGRAPLRRLAMELILVCQKA